MRHDRAIAIRPPLLFLHGAFGGPHIWRRFVAPFFEARGYTVAAPELAARDAGPLRMRDYVAAARAAADELGGRPVVIGHSLGGLVAQHLAAEGRASAMALVAAPGPMGAGPSLWKLAALHPRALAALMLAQAGAGAVLGPQAARATLFTETASDAWIMANAPPPRPESPLALWDAMTWDLPMWPLARGRPTLALLGDRDAFVPAADLTAIAMAYGAETEIMPDMAHGAPIDPHWKRLAWRLTQWLEDRVRATG
jgi:pimeloyl-ACP methyl ester carboxylesterase